MTIKEARSLIGNTNKSDEAIQSMIEVADALSDVAIDLMKDLYRKEGRDEVANWPKNR